ncbi:signal recognition particle-docking protein FtsY [Sulfobacillus thermosulfidooxidans]|uniref:signal recognition particle-docking protein FtsY n=1 Tax=Sulfobacillus thermosulfidooxidans TaxID=28034 RepID=UPI00096BC671|nr:signal recognition particle-docking protein FtsY [Sulfobacillus thermosulfidooxidans]OLZ16273.1 signal recognition particle-docking protein FtsY [Sulfobacillus thermosulfidooxidans]OLZ18511.1 signal recognition particle-docking protein FtsY [Sulfobacillus thermosulfidooxidans]
MAGFWNRLKEGMTRTRDSLGGRLRTLFQGRQWDDSLWDQLEEILFEADLGYDTVDYLLTQLREEVRISHPQRADDVIELLRRIMVDLFEKASDPTLLDPQRPSIWLMVGVNGTGKTTTAGKFAYMMKRQGYQVILGAADTFRAAAVEQLQEWGQRAGVDVISQGAGADSAAVAYDTVQAAIARSRDLAIIDTAGRLHNKSNLMQELQKVVRVIRRERPDAPHQVWLVIDATTGQNGLAQAQVFLEAVQVTGIVLTKLDGTAKGGIALSIKRELGVPIRFIGVGEKVEDLMPFDAESYVRAILGD